VSTGITAVVFDFDGVLADTERLHLRAIQDALAEYGHTLEDRLYFDRYLGYGDRDVLVEFARDRGWSIDDAIVDAFMAHKSLRYRHHLASGRALYPGASACVECLGERFALAIASGSLRAEILHILDSAGLQPSFRAIVGADDVSSGKPSPEPYLKAAQLLGIDPRQAVAIEDSRWGIESAHAAGMSVIGITTSYPAATLARADRVVDSLDAITVASIADL
jgi:beta-phosphoglucomutase